MKVLAPIVALALWGCESEVRPAWADVEVTADVSSVQDTAGSDVATADDTAAPEDIEAPVEDVVAAPDDPGPPVSDVPAGTTCDCDTAASIVWLQSASHGSCSPPAPGKAREICKDAHTKEFETGDTFGVKGCKFEVSC